MAFTIPNWQQAIEDPTGVYGQAQTDKVDWDILVQGINGEGVSSGCAVTPQGAPNMTVAVASGTVVVAGSEAVVSAGNVTITAAHATLRRYDLVVANASGTKSVTAGTAATSPVFPSVPASSVCLAAVYVPAADTAIQGNQIIDKRCLVATPASNTGWITVSKAADQTKNSNTTLAVDSILKFTMAANTKYRFRAWISVSADIASDFKWRHAGPASPTILDIFRRYYSPAGGAVFSDGHDLAYSAADLTIDFGSPNPATYVIEFEGIIHNGANAGDFQFQWAQNTSNAANTTVRAGSYIEYKVA